MTNIVAPSPLPHLKNNKKKKKKNNNKNTHNNHNKQENMLQHKLTVIFK